MADAVAVGAWRYVLSGPVGRLTITRAPVNALTTEDWQALPALLATIARDPISVLIVSGDGRHFCAGNDKNEFARDVRRADEVTAAVRDGLRALAELPVPAIAAVSGAALGSGFMIASLCDERICSQDARFGLPEILVGAFGGYSIARTVLPAGAARAMVLGAENLFAGRAHELGYVRQVCATREEVLDQATALAAKWAEADRYALREAKRTFAGVEHCDLWAGYELERGLAVRHMTMNS